MVPDHATALRRIADRLAELRDAAAIVRKSAHEEWVQRGNNSRIFSAADEIYEAVLRAYRISDGAIDQYLC